MYQILWNRFKQGKRTHAYPKAPLELPEMYRGLPLIQGSDKGEEAATHCPQQAIFSSSIDLGKCIFCGECEQRSNSEFVRFSNCFEMSTNTREELIVSEYRSIDAKSCLGRKSIRELFGRSFQLRQVSAGGCNACESDINVLNTPFFDLARFGVQIVASPRHADGLMITGPVTLNMKHALLKTYNATPAPKLVIAVGSCAIAGGPFYDSPEVIGGVDELLPVDLFIPGCPPHPMTILSAIVNYLSLHH
ncbi:MAG: NADH-quinone oxidoreductase subunit NuoB [Oligoflexia bacterium]|nr:NADH-quinone oxidoreductase subunit NuoB [Oligoflexia bacterium]MBF0365174.1 NADH-quinone oxidoreductase subunit NuoB [Oligoflexia bacterium]